MKTYSELLSIINNIEHLTEKADKLAREQIELDCSLKKVNVNIGTLRFNALGALGSACNWIETYCESMKANLNTAMKQDKLLQSEEE